MATIILEPTDVAVVTGVQLTGSGHFLSICTKSAGADLSCSFMA
jgi:hypothetical protein